MEPLNDKVAIVTGASSGMGEAIARAFVILGIHVIALARREDRLKKIAESLEGSDGTFHPLQTDVRKEEDIIKAFEYTEAQYGRVDILVNAAGVMYIEPITNGSTDHFREILETNTLAAAINIREFTQSIRKNGGLGHIILINSVFGRNALLSKTPASLYQASKYALHAILANVIQEITENKYPIKISGIYPGLVKTELLEKAGVDDKGIYDKFPYLEPSDIANAVLFVLKTPANVQISEMHVTPLHGELP